MVNKPNQGNYFSLFTDLLMNVTEDYKDEL